MGEAAPPPGGWQESTQWTQTHRCSSFSAWFLLKLNQFRVRSFIQTWLRPAAETKTSCQHGQSPLGGALQTLNQLYCTACVWSQNQTDQDYISAGSILESVTLKADSSSLDWAFASWSGCEMKILIRFLQTAVRFSLMMVQTSGFSWSGRGCFSFNTTTFLPEHIMHDACSTLK